MYPLDDQGFDIFDLDLSLAFRKFSIDNLIKIILCLLAESKVVFMSKTVGLLTPLIQIFFKLIHPFKWILPYVPLLPCSQLEYLEAPNPFIMGISSEFEDQINKENELILIDIDTGEVKIPDSIVLKSNFNQVSIT